MGSEMGSGVLLFNPPGLSLITWAGVGAWLSLREGVCGGKQRQRQQDSEAGKRVHGVMALEGCSS